MSLRNRLMRAAAHKRIPAGGGDYFADAAAAGATSLFDFTEGIAASTYVDSISGKNLSFVAGSGRALATPPNEQFAPILFPVGCGLATPAATASAMLMQKNFIWSYEIVCRRTSPTAAFVFLLTQTCRNINQNRINTITLDHETNGKFFIYESDAASSRSAGSGALGGLDLTQWMIITVRSLGDYPNNCEIYVDGVLTWTFNRNVNFGTEFNGPVNRTTLLWRDFNAGTYSNGALEIGALAVYDQIILTPAQILANAQSAGFA